MEENLYRVLGLEPRASSAQIERAYRFHVELYSEDTLATSTLVDGRETERQRRRLREAYEVLSDPDRRRSYDESAGFPPPDSLAPPTTAEAAETAPPEPPPSFGSPNGDRDGPVTFAEPVSATAEIRERRLAALLSPASPSFEAFRVLRTKVLAIDAERPARCLGVVSATAQEGTTAVAAGLAAALAQERGRRVLLVEAALRAPNLEQALGLAVEPGLGQWLEAPAPRPLPLRRIEPWGFHLLAAGPPLPQAAERLAPERLRSVLLAARASYDFVVLDCPPLESVADAAVLQGALDGFLFVVRARHASRLVISQALARLEAGAVRGMVLNDRTEILARWLDRRRQRPPS